MQFAGDRSDVCPYPALRRHPLVNILQDGDSAPNLADLVLLILAGNRLAQLPFRQAHNAVAKPPQWESNRASKNECGKEQQDEAPGNKVDRLLPFVAIDFDRALVHGQGTRRRGLADLIKSFCQERRRITRSGIKRSPPCGIRSTRSRMFEGHCPVRHQLFIERLRIRHVLLLPRIGRSQATHPIEESSVAATKLALQLFPLFLVFFPQEITQEVPHSQQFVLHVLDGTEAAVWIVVETTVDLGQSLQLRKDG